MAQYAWADGDFKIDVSDGGSLTSMKAYIDVIDTWEVTRPEEEYTTLGSTWEAFVLQGIRAGNAFKVGGLFDDTASTGPHVVFGTSAHTATRSFEVIMGSTNKTAGECWITGYRRFLKKGKSRWEATIRPTGTMTES